VTVFGGTTHPPALTECVAFFRFRYLHTC
jgi:hypothetical protein